MLNCKSVKARLNSRSAVSAPKALLSDCNISWALLAYNFQRKERFKISITHALAALFSASELVLNADTTANTIELAKTVTVAILYHCPSGSGWVRPSISSSGCNGSCGSSVGVSRPTNQIKKPTSNPANKPSLLPLVQ